MPQRLHRSWPLLLFLPILPGVTFLFLYGLPMTHDGATHLLRIARLDEYLRAGFLFPRWLPDLILGHGYPALNYYASGTYYLVEGLHLLGLNLYYAFIVAQVVLLYLTAVGMYLFARDLFDEERPIPALVTSIAYVYAPYLLINIYIRGAIAELGAQMLLPWILWSFRRLWCSPEPRRYVLLATFALGGLAWTHTISLLIIPPLLLAYLTLLLSQSTDYPRRIGWSMVAGVGAIGISAFYWLPLLGERHYISDVGVAISKTLMLPISFIDWRNFLDTGFVYTFPEDPPFRFGLLQVTGTLVGLCFLPRKGRELWFWVGVLVFCLLMMSNVSRPLWFSNDILPIIQLPWRLQALMQFPVALLFGLPLTMLRSPWLRAVAALVLISLLIRVHLPDLPWAYLLSDESSFSMAQNAYFEAERTYVIESSEMTTTVQEFRPKWADQTLTLDPASVPPPVVSLTTATLAAQHRDQSTPDNTTLHLTAANPFHLQLQIAGDTPFPLRFATFFFPGWTATLDHRTELIPYPSTNLGLLTVDVPAGKHILTVAWSGTAIARWGGIISQVTLLGLGIWQLTQHNAGRWWGVVPLVCLSVGLVATYGKPAPQPVQHEHSLVVPGLELMGYHQPTVTPEGIRAELYWLVTETAPSPLALRWQLLDERGRMVAETVSAPFYDTYTTAEWVRDTVVDDAYLIPVPTAASAGRYTLVMRPLGPQGEDGAPTPTAPPLAVGTVRLPGTQSERAPEIPVAVHFENQIALQGYDVQVVDAFLEEERHLPNHPDLLTIAAGKTLDYRLYWQTAQETNEPYVSFIHLTDHLGQPLAQYDHLPGPLFRPPALWTTYNQYRDKFIVAIPQDAESGLYWPNVGMYNWEDESRIPAHTSTGEALGDHVKLSPIKVVNPTIRSRGTARDVHFGSLATLISFEVEGGRYEKEDGLLFIEPGAQFMLTIYYRVQEPSTEPLRRFIQVRDASNQMVAQADGEPQNGVNPTWSWLPGELVRERILLQMPVEAAAGTYQLFLGFYQPTGDFARVPVFDPDGVALANHEVELFEIRVPEAGESRAGK